LFGVAAGHIAPGMHFTGGAFAVVAMAAVFGAATRATFASIVFMRETLMTEKLTRRGLPSDDAPAIEIESRDMVAVSPAGAEQSGAEEGR